MWKVAIIDDDRQVLKGMKQVIPWEEIGAELVGEGLNGKRGLELIREKKPDIIITDIYMPEMNGMKMIEALRKESFAGKILIHSGYSDFEVARQALRLQVEDYLSKPVSRKTITEVLLRTITSIENENQTKIEHDKLRDQLDEYEPFVRKEQLKTVVTGTASNWEEITYLCKDEDDQSHIVLGIEILRTTRISSVRTQDRLLFRFAIKNIIKEILQTEEISYDYVELDGYHAALILHYEKHAHYSEHIDSIRDIAREIIRCVQDYLDITIRIGIGRFTENWSNLSDSLEEAFQPLVADSRVIQSTGIFEYASMCQDSFKHKEAIDYIKQYIRENYAKDITIAELADKVHISRNYLSQIFKNATGETVNNYIISVKMEEAKRFILERKYKIYEVANKVGYNNIPYFSTTFRKYFGITPAELLT